MKDSVMEQAQFAAGWAAARSGLKRAACRVPLQRAGYDAQCEFGHLTPAEAYQKHLEATAMPRQGQMTEALDGEGLPAGGAR